MNPSTRPLSPSASRGRPWQARRVWLGLLAGWGLALAGCAGPSSLRTEVSSFGAWPAALKPGSFAYERLPSQEPQAEVQAQLEEAARPALERAGFRSVAPGEVAQFSVQVGSRVRLDRRYRYDPIWTGWAPYGYHLRGGVGGGWGGRRGGIGYSLSMEPPAVQMQVDMLIRDRQNNQVVYETHAMLDRYGSAPPSLFAPLFDAALKDFPQPALSPRMVTVPLQPE